MYSLDDKHSQAFPSLPVVGVQGMAEGIFLNREESRVERAGTWRQKSGDKVGAGQPCSDASFESLTFNILLFLVRWRECCVGEGSRY